ncbi:DNA topoisomerase II [Heracleum sosnowskyi]|uniref:DNA topoisomerase (ATP-hydrolyzing) n=1 Tax=Heracleum sosnowskyi TaxID=360622 RepID=A0AAD8HNC2_9APIA|nr:DNA topoisomerase II [Heracleum sosnowskyi]
MARSVPSVVDGLTPGQRKILFSSFRKNFIRETSVEQFKWYVLKHSAYQHGEQSLAESIIGMAQDFVGTNNMNLFLPKGGCGTRSTGGIPKDYEFDSGRYSHTQLSPITRCLFPKNDDIHLDYVNEHGQNIEPIWYVPVIPMVLVNGCEGRGQGWSTYVPNYNPRDIVANVRRLLNGEPMQPMHPWYKGFKGTTERTATKEAGATYTVSGLIEQIDDNTLDISELPIRRWTQDYKDFLESMMTANDKVKEPFIKAYKDYSDDVAVKLLVSMSEENMLKAKQEGLLKKFKLTTTISTSNMHLFDPKGVIKKYDNPEQIIEDFFQKFLLNNLELDLLKLDNKVRFILGVGKGKIKVFNSKKADLFLELKEKGFTPFPKIKVEEVITGASDAVETEENSEGTASVEAGDYDYLLQMEIGTLTLEGVQELLKERDQLNDDVNELRRATPMSFWNKDLDALDAELDAQNKRDAKEEVVRQQRQYWRMNPQELQDLMMNEPDHKPSRQAPKNPRKISKNVISTATVAKSVDTSAASAMETDTVHEVVNPKGKAKGKEAPIKMQRKPTSTLRDEDDHEIRDQSEAMEVELRQKEAKKKPPSRKKGSAANEVEKSFDNEDIEVQVVEKKKAGRKAAAGKAKAAKPPAAPAATKKRGLAAQMVGQKLIADVLKPAEKSPEKKVRKMRASSFNKKSGSLLGRAAAKDTKDASVSPISEEEFGGSTSNLDTIGGGGSSETMTRVITRPQRANRTRKTYVLSDSESEKEATDGSEFNEDED